MAKVQARARTNSDTRVRKKERRKVSHAVVRILAGSSNTIVTVADARNGAVLTFSSGGRVGQQNARKGTPFAAQEAVQAAVRAAIDQYGVESVSVVVSGIGPGREMALNAVVSFRELSYVQLTDWTRTPHNGCKRPKRRSN